MKKSGGEPGSFSAPIGARQVSAIGQYRSIQVNTGQYRSIQVNTGQYRSMKKNKNDENEA
jgi:hypothetical protein